ncbi:polyprenyl synthetase family protein [Desulfobulbus alkaliphilus]|uniref:polyprenyl synthetase family protein n=1 Tax=Desulfobulbus alkaliphilus TaxID=869814 RepID=UPI0019651CFD|nr:polyprenyl synthetase family protein [Desulfobulbus alkaliphilus]MBM9537842.1 polyprenyl synthetase family protein [Desulfobulbus alkaliphilus]
MNPSAPDQFSALLAAAAAIGARTDTAMRSDLETALADCDPLLIEVLHYALFNGGKRIRPLLTVLCSRCCGRDDAPLYLLAAAFEYLHVATLAHDDVIDRADHRRGRPSVAARFGPTAAILAGDWLHARSMHLIGRLAGADGLDIFCAATAAMVNGEFAQLRHIADLNTKQHHYFAVIRQKTSNLIASACSIGALYAGADRRQRDALATYGDRIGAAFQVVDDLLDFKGESGTTGKKTGNDFVEGKMTLPVLLALEKASAEQRQVMKTLLEGDRSQVEALARIHALVEDLDGFKGAARIARRLIDEALEPLAIFSRGQQEQENTERLRELAGFILARKK